jgi:hypothetical protein
MLYHIAYVSSSVLAMDGSLLSEILDVSVRNNERDGITGVLMYNENQFFQLLEGEKSLVNRCFARIERDHRHKGVSTVWDYIAERRVFPIWAMGYAGPEEFGDGKDDSQVYLAKMLGEEQALKDGSSVALMLARSFYKDFKRSYTLRHFPQQNRKVTFNAS